MTQDSEQTIKETKSTSSRRSNSSSTKATNHSSTHSGSNRSEKKDKTRDGLQTRVVIRHLPPTMTSEQFLEEISPIPEYNDYYLMKADTSLGIHGFSRAYINFIHMEDVFIFKDKFDNYVFVDSKGNEYSAIVEFAPFQKIPRRRIGANGQPISAKKRDNKSGTIEQDSDYLTFLEDLEKDKNEANMPSAEVYLEEIEARDKELRANHGVLKVSTPLIEFIKNKKQEKMRLREERREERRRLQLEQKRLREEEHQRKLRQMKKLEDKKHIKDGKDNDQNSKEDKKSLKREDERNRLKTRDSDKRETNKSYEISKKFDSKKSTQTSRHSNEKVKDISNNETTFVVKVLQNPDKDKTPEHNSKNNSDNKKSETNSDKKVTTHELKEEVSSDLRKREDSKTDRSESSSRSDSRRIRNKDRPTREIYKPGAVKRISGTSDSAQANADSSNDHKSGTNRAEHGYKNRVFTRTKQ